MIRRLESQPHHFKVRTMSKHHFITYCYADITTMTSAIFLYNREVSRKDFTGTYRSI